MSQAKPTPSLDAALDELAAAIARLAYPALGEPTIARARQCTFDTLAAAAIGLSTPEGKALQALESAPATTQASRMAEQIRLHTGAARTTEIDDIDIVSCTSAGAVIVPVALAYSAAGNGDGQRLLTAIVAGYEAMIRLGRALGGATILYRGIWPTYATAAFGAAATAAKMLALDARATAQALALALEATSVPPAGAFAGFASRYDALGRAAAAGAQFARAALDGADADPNAFEHYAARLGVRIDANELVRYSQASGRIHEVDTKLFPTSRQALASVEAFLSLAPEIGAIEEIDRIIVHVPGTYRDMVDRPSLPLQRIESMTGVQYAMALAYLRPEKLYDALRTDLPTDARIASLMAKIDVRASSQLDTFFPQRWGSTVTVHRKNGQLVTQEILEPSGSRSREVDWRKLGRKVARICAASGLGNAQFVSNLLERCRMLAASDERYDAIELLELLAPARSWLPRGSNAIVAED